MQICPDCKRAKISQNIPLQKRYGCSECPDCGGYFFDDKWYSAPKYPVTDEGWNEVISAPSGGKCKKVAGVWRDYNFRKIS